MFFVDQSYPALCDPMDCISPGSSICGDSPDKNTGVGVHAHLQGIFPGIEPRSPTLQVDSLSPIHLGSSTEVTNLQLCLVAQSCPTLCDLMDCSPPGSLVHGDSPGKNTGVGCHALLQGIFPGIEPRSPTSQADSLPSKPPGRPQNTGVGSLSLLQENFPTQ